MSIVSATKYYSGHSDVMGGSLAVNKKVFNKVKSRKNHWFKIRDLMMHT
jgi:cystathionine beta-lyase